MRHVQSTRDFLNFDFYVRSFRIFHIHNTHSSKLKFKVLKNHETTPNFYLIESFKSLFKF
jgi:hypothetical protein